MHTLAENYTAISLIKPQSIAATTTGSNIDVEKYNDDCMVIMDLGALGGTTETFVGTVETSVLGDFSDTVTALTFGSVTGSAGDNLIAAGKVNLHGIKKMRGKITMSGTSASLVGMVALVNPSTHSAATNSVTPA